MGFIFRKSFKVAPGLSLNVSKRGMGVSVGGRNTPRVTVNSEGRVTNSVRIAPGLRYQKTSSLKKRSQKNSAATNPEKETEFLEHPIPAAEPDQREPRDLWLPHSFWSVFLFAVAGFISATQESYDKIVFFILAIAAVSGVTYFWNLVKQNDHI
jgi:hypothetical protein